LPQAGSRVARTKDIQSSHSFFLVAAGSVTAGKEFQNRRFSLKKEWNLSRHFEYRRFYEGFAEEVGVTAHEKSRRSIGSKPRLEE
jgi:hypothetical protein